MSPDLLPEGSAWSDIRETAWQGPKGGNPLGGAMHEGQEVTAALRGTP